ncbi:uncharacterized protein LOC113116418 [Carassius auratus]|uniref:Uncharacterized protein LOC113116418 n=1 Tax=Carassius auratus TaxID=7957 RepID=A0A6P6R4A6_CARAU|nr:uncharacterized protein LOC113116418 [Carassius auratus]
MLSYLFVLVHISSSLHSWQVRTHLSLSCFDSPPTSSVLVTWKMTAAREDRWSYLLSANCIDGQTDGRSSRVFGGRKFGISADASLTFRAAAAVQGRYSCVIEQRIVLLGLIKCMCLISLGILLSFSFAVSVTPTPPVTVDSTVRLAAQVSGERGCLPRVNSYTLKSPMAREVCSASCLASAVKTTVSVPAESVSMVSQGLWQPSLVHWSL